jgi:hypothetical protein
MDVQITLVVPAVIHAQAEALARRLGLTRSGLYTEAVADWLDLHGEPAGGPAGADGEDRDDEPF